MEREGVEAGWFWRGVMIGLAVAASVGPIGVLCIKRSLSFGSRTGFITGLGAATVDALYVGLAAFRLTAISSLFLAGQNIQAAGGLLLIYLVLNAVSPGQTDVPGAGRMQMASNHVSTVALTLANSPTIVSFLAPFSAAMPVANGPYLAATSGPWSIHGIGGVVAGLEQRSGSAAIAGGTAYRAPEPTFFPAWCCPVLPSIRLQRWRSKKSA
jgi:threonine/homoserine/homoserine lactone efflux protein